MPAAAGACRVIRIDGFALVVEADAPIVAQELRLRATELLAAFAASPAGIGARELRVSSAADQPSRPTARTPARRV